MAGGISAITSSAKHVFKQVGLQEGTKVMLKVNQTDGFDCPGCAWPDPDHDRSTFEFCENGAKAVAEEATKNRVGAKFFRKHTIAKLSRWSDYELGKSGRLVEPMVIRPGKKRYERISWEGAFQLIAEHLNALASPDEAIFYTSGRTSNEAAFLYQLFVREYGTNNLPDCSNMCHESSGVGLSETLGIGKGSVKLDDFYKAEVIVVMGQNPGTNHPRMLAALQKAKQNGCQVITINPLPEAGLIKFQHPQSPADLFGKPTVITDLFLQVKINEDVALLKALMKILLEKERENPGKVMDYDFVNSKTFGYEALIKDLERYDLEDLIHRTGIQASKVKQAAEVLANKNKIIVCWAMGLTQHKNAVDNIREIVNLLLMKGSIGKPGAGTCPVRGHSNVQGDRTMGIHESPKPAFLDKLDEVLAIKSPRKEGYNTVQAIKAMKEGEAKVFIAMGGNFLSATPDTEYTAEALQNCDLTVQISTKLNRSHLIHGKTALILPCLGRTELDQQTSGSQFVTVENSTGVVHQSRGGKAPASKKLLSEPKIVAELANATFGNRTKADWNHLVDDYDRIRDLIEKIVPGFDDYNRRVRNPGGFYLPNAPREGNFTTSTEKAHFTINSLSSIDLKRGQYLMMTIRSHDQFNTTIYGLHDRYRGIYNERRVVFMNEQDMMEADLKERQVVDLTSHYDGIARTAKSFIVIPYDIPQQCIATYFPEANALVPANHYAEKSHTPISKSVVVKISVG